MAAIGGHDGLSNVVAEVQVANWCTGGGLFVTKVFSLKTSRFPGVVRFVIAAVPFPCSWLIMA